MASGRYTAVQSIVSSVTMRANGHKALRFSRPLTPRCLCCQVCERGRRAKGLPGVRDHPSLPCSQPVMHEHVRASVACRFLVPHGDH